MNPSIPASLEEQLAATRRELEEANAVLAAIRQGHADALLVDTADGPRVYTLESADEPYRTIVESLQEGAVTIGADDVILYCNEAFARLVGRECDALVGTSLAAILGTDAIAALTSGSGARGHECRLDAADGRRLTCQVSSARHAADADVIWCLLVTDLTGQALRLRHDAIVESTDDAIASFDLAGRITTWNRAAQELFGYAAAEVVGQSGELLVPVGERDEAFLAACSGEKFQRDTQRVARDGTRIDVSVTASPMRAPDGSIVGVSAIVRDIRDRKAAEARLASIRDALSVGPSADPANDLLPETTFAARQSAFARAQRLECMTDADLFDASRTEALDQITRLAASVLQAPVSLITVIDDSRQLFVSSWGLPEPIRSAGGTPLSESYCQHVIEAEAPIVVRDAERNPLVRGIGAWRAGFVAYLGVPVRDYAGHVIASLSVADSRARVWTERELHTLEGIGRLLMREIANRAVLRELSESQHRLTLALEASSTGMWDWNVVNGAIVWSPGCYRVFGVREGGFDGTAEAFERLVHPDDRARVWSAVQSAIDGGITYQCQFRICRPDGQVRWVANLGRVLYDERHRAARLVGTVVDVTDQKHAEEAREARQRELEDADRQKNEFLAMLAHELRNPLAPIRTASELLMRTVGRDERTHAVVDIVRRQAHQLTRIVDDLLDISRITVGRIELSRAPLELAGIVNEAVEAVEPLLRERSHALTVVSHGTSAYVSGDRVRLVQCLTNLLTNAAKYTDPGGRIQVTSAVEGDTAVLSVTDSGIGIAPELLPKVFDLFVQSERALDRAAGGLGIGLSVVQKLVAMHGGTVTAASGGPGQGSTFTIRLPTIQAPVARVDAAAPVQAVASRRILVVDDNVDAASALAMLLRLDGHHVEVVHDARTAVDRATRGRHDLVLLDIGLPEFDGYEAVRRIRGALDGHAPRLVALTGYGQREDRARALSAGFDDHAVKPVDVATLQRLLGDAPPHESNVVALAEARAAQQHASRAER